MVKIGKEAIDQVYETVSQILDKTDARKELLANDINIEIKLAYYICRDLGLICGYVDNQYKGEREWLYGCTRPPRARGVCMKHFQRKYMKYVYDDESGKLKQEYEFPEEGGKEIKEKRKKNKKE